MFLILRIVTCTLKASLCHFSYVSWIWQRYTKYLPLGNYTFHLSTQKKVLCFQLSHLRKVFTCFRQKASIFPSSWSSLWCLFQHRDKDRRQSKFGRMIVWREMPCWFIRKVKHLLCFLLTYFPPSPLLLLFWTNPLMKTQDLCMLEAEVFYLFTDHCSFCAMQLVVLWRNIHYSEWLQTPSSFCWPVIPVWLPWKTASPTHDRKADTILKMTLFYQGNNMAKDSMQSASLSLEEKTHMILNNKRRSALRRHPGNANIKLKQFWGKHK